MIIDKGVCVGEVITLKLTSGEELVAKLVEETPTHYKLAKIQVIGMGPKGPGLMPYLFTVNPDKDVKLLKTTVTVAEATDEVFAKQFLQSTTGIALM
jgi:uncharacterized alpha/beta hydrolase family protein